MQKDIQQDTSNLDTIDDSGGLAEIQKAMAEIERLEKGDPSPTQDPSHVNGSHEEEENEEQDLTPESREEEREEGDKKHKRHWKETKRWYGAQAEIARLHQENERIAEANSQLQQHLNEALNVGTYHYGKSIYGELEAAKDAKDKAIDDGDKRGLIEADIRINRIVNKIDELEKWGANTNTARVSPPPVSPAAPPMEVYQDMAQDWLETHPYLQPNSPQYDKELAQKVSNYVVNLDRRLMHEGRKDLFYSPEYFADIDRNIEYLQSVESPKGNTGGFVGGVRNAYPSTTGRNIKSNQVLLSADEKMMAYNAGVSESDWLKQKIAYTNKRG